MSGLPKPADPGLPPASPGVAYRRMKWCVDCGAIQWGASSCQACEGTYRFDPLGFEDLYKAYADPLRRFVRRLAADRGLPESAVDTEGAVHDTFVVLLSGSRQPIRNPPAWLFAVARRKVSKAAAAQRRIAPGDPADCLNDGPAWAALASPPADAEDVRAAREVMDAIAGLPGHQRVATYLRQVQGWSYAEIGAYLDCAAETAGVHISRGTAKVRSSLSAGRDAYIQVNYNGVVIHLSSLWRRRARFAVLTAVVGTWAGSLLGIAILALGMPRWLADVTAAAAVVAAISVGVRWCRREEAAWRHERRFNCWLRTGRALDPPGGTRQP